MKSFPNPSCCHQQVGKSFAQFSNACLLFRKDSPAMLVSPSLYVSLEGQLPRVRQWDSRSWLPLPGFNFNRVCPYVCRARIVPAWQGLDEGNPRLQSFPPHGDPPASFDFIDQGVVPGAISRSLPCSRRLPVSFKFTTTTTSLSLELGQKHATK
jgi:hypothetical protein